VKKTRRVVAVSLTLTDLAGASRPNDGRTIFGLSGSTSTAEEIDLEGRGRGSLRQLATVWLNEESCADLPERATMVELRWEFDPAVGHDDFYASLTGNCN